MSVRGNTPNNADMAEAPFGEKSSASVRCPLCSHSFHPGKTRGNVYCAQCGKRFNPFSHLDETVAVPGPETQDGKASSSHAEAVNTIDASDGVTERIGDYDILSEIARGGMGVVYRARQRNLRRTVALKVLRGGEGATEEDLARFMREAEAAASLSHPNIVPIHDLSVWQGKHFFTMDYIEGTPIDRMLDNGPFTPNHTCELVENIARAIHYAHTRGIIHRDLKPANIIVDSQGRPMITDFGLAVNLGNDMHSQRMTRTGAIMGTIPYIPPEQASGRVQAIDERSDVYSIGAVMYEMLTGHPPYTGQTQYELLRRVIQQDPVLPRKRNPRIHPDAETICMKCLEKDKRRRYDTAEALADDCARFLQGEVIAARPATVLYRTRRYLARYRTYAAAAGAIVTLLLALLVTSERGSQLNEELEKTKVEAEQHRDKAYTLALENKQKEEELKRVWRQEFVARFETKSTVTGKQDDALRLRRVWANERMTAIHSKPGRLVLTAVKPDRQALPAVAIPVPFSQDFRWSSRIRVPEENGGAPVFFIDADNRFEVRDITYLLKLGVPGNPGSKATKARTLVTAAPKTSLEPGVWHEVIVTRFENSLEVRLGETQLLQLEVPPGRTAVSGNHLGVSVIGGAVEIAEMSVSVLGLNRPMIASLLDVADNLMLHGDEKLAIKLYERVVVEKSTRSRDHLAALRGFARCVSHTRGKDTRKILEECDRLVDQMALSRPVHSGEGDFLKGVALAESKVRNNIDQALSCLSKAVTSAVPSEDSLIRFGPCRVVGPFDASGDEAFYVSYDPEQEYDPAAVYAGKNGPVQWRITGAPEAQGDLINFTGSAAEIEDSVYYIRRVYTCSAEMPAFIHTGSDDGLVVWVNGSLVLSKNLKRPLQRDSERTSVVLSAGENEILMKVHNMQGGSGFYLRVEPYARSAMGMYGRLAQLERALVYMRHGQIEDAMRAFREMQSVRRFGNREFDCALDILAGQFDEEIRVSGALPYVLERVDQLLRRKVSLDAAFGFLEAMRTLFPDANQELASRYQQLATVHAARNDIPRAEAAYRMAESLVPEWHIPRLERVRLRLSRQQDSEALIILDQALRDLPQSLELSLAAARIYLQPVEGRPRAPGKALQTATRALQLSDNENVSAWRLAAEAHLHLGDLTEAQASIQQAILLQESPHPADMLFAKKIRDMTGQSEYDETAPDPEPPVGDE